MAPAIGIDLGTTYSRVAVFRHGKVEIIANEIGSRATPSYVAFTDKGRLVGEPAKRQAAMNPKNTIFDVKRLIGRRLSDTNIHEDRRHWPFDVVRSKGKPMLQAKFKGEQQIFAPEEISSMILGKMKETAEKFLGTEVKDAVITVPAYFNDSQRQATKDAGAIAGLNVLQIINEPTAAALAYGLQRELKGERNVLIYDLGGGTFDVTVLTMTDATIFKVRSTSGNTRLGGEDFDRLIVQFLAQKFKEQHVKDIQGNPRAMSHLRAAAETAKRDLSSSIKSIIDIDLLFEGNDFATHVSQRRFNDLCLDLFERTLEHVKFALTEAKMDKTSIDDIVLVGGSTRILKVQELLRDFFCGKELNLSLNPDEAVVYGAAVQAAILSGERDPAIKEVLIIDVTPLSLGLPGSNGQMFNLIKRNTQVPFTRKVPFKYTGARSSSHEVYEGEAHYVSENNIVCTFVLYEIPANAQGTTCVNFELDTNCILKVYFGEENALASEKIAVLKNNLLENDIIVMIKKSKRYKEDEKRELERITERSNFELYIYETKARFSKNEANPEDNYIKVHFEKALKWLRANPHMAKEEYEEKKNWLQAKVQENDEEKKLLVDNSHVATQEDEKKKTLQLQEKVNDGKKALSGGSTQVSTQVDEEEKKSLDEQGDADEHL